MLPVQVYTDGGCHHNLHGAGGWGYVVKHPDGTRTEDRGGEMHTTNNRMELMAAVQALETIPPGIRIVLTTDSVYLQRGINLWIDNWMKTNWRTYDGDPVKNKDLWLRLLKAKEQHEVIFEWARGHSGHWGNERAHLLASMGRKQAYEDWQANEGRPDKTAAGAA
jgi:ribonuclease HI